jgi:hypothetical protein
MLHFSRGIFSGDKRRGEEGAWEIAELDDLPSSPEAILSKTTNAPDFARSTTPRGQRGYRAVPGVGKIGQDARRRALSYSNL